MRTTGSYTRVGTAGERFGAFVPAPLPPEPPLSLTPEDHELLARATRALERLDGWPRARCRNSLTAS